MQSTTKRTRTRIAPLGSVAAAAMLLAAGASPATAASRTGELAAAHPEAGPLALASAAVAAAAGGYGLKLMRRRRTEEAEASGATSGLTETAAPTASPEPSPIAGQQKAPDQESTAEPANSAS